MAAWLVAVTGSLIYAILPGIALALALTGALFQKNGLTIGTLIWPWVISVGLMAALFSAQNLVLPTTPPKRPASTALRIAHQNLLWYSTANPAAKLDFVRTADADLISLVEVNDNVANQILANNPYPYHFYTATAAANLPASHLPMMVLSRWPITLVHAWSGRALAFRVDNPGKPFIFIQLHPQSPYLPKAWQWRNEELAGYPTPTFTEPTVIVGDLNTTPWDTALAPLRQAYTLQGPWLPTFPSFMPVVPIDLLFTQGAWPVPRIQRVRTAGADHLGLVADFATLP
jgi:endonuclease/exonuclease/phosphatase (EEP) superfamily protein YafD